jgi:glycosyltransferase involved in cell wall biosynthesis
MQEADLYVSFSNYETFGVVYIEALATKTPVICTDTGILTEYDITDAYKIIPIKGQEQLKLHLLNYLDKKYKIDGAKMRDFVVSNFSYQSVAQHYTQLYNEILNNE